VYDGGAPWPATPDGDGPSLEIIDPLGDASNPANWRASAAIGGSPGASGVGLKGDYDGNSLVDENDHNAWRANFGSVVPPGSGADGNGDGVVDAADYIVWRNAFSTGSASATAVAAFVETTESATATDVVTQPISAFSPPKVHTLRTRPPGRTALPVSALTHPAPYNNLLLTELKDAAIDMLFSDGLYQTHSDGLDRTEFGDTPDTSTLDDVVRKHRAWTFTQSQRD
jgi:hypothetical protein